MLLDWSEVAGLVRRPGLQGLDELARDGLLAAFLGDQQPAGQVKRHADAADDGQHRQHDPHDRDVDAKGTGEPGGDSGQHPVLEGPAERLRPDLDAGFWVDGGPGVGFWACRGCVHGSSLLPRAWPGYREDPRLDPDDPPAGSGFARMASRADLAR